MVGPEEFYRLTKQAKERRPELRACPWCGNKEPRLCIDVIGERVVYFIDCERYACNREEVEYFYEMEDAINDWNRRVERG